VDYIEGSGKDAQEWIDELDKRIKDGRYTLGKIWLPHDARAKTFAAKHSAVEQFAKYFGVARIDIVPMATKSDRINAARTVMPRCEFNKSRCEDGLDGLSNWAYKWNPDRKEFTSEPVHDWASHPSDGFSYGALVMRERQPVVAPTPKIILAGAQVAKAVGRRLTFDEACKLQDQRAIRRSRI